MSEEILKHLAKATNKGDLKKTPFAHLLIYLKKRNLSGTLQIMERDALHSVYFLSGRPAKAQLASDLFPLPKMLIEEGVIKEYQLQEALDYARQNNKPLGLSLVQTGLMDAAQLIHWQVKQLRNQLVYIFGLPEGPYGFFQDENRLITGGHEELVIVEPFEILMHGLRMHGHSVFLALLLGKIHDKHFFVDEADDLETFGFTREERRFVRKLTENQWTMNRLPGIDGMDMLAGHRVIYALLATGLLKIGTEEQIQDDLSKSGIREKPVLETKPPMVAIDESKMPAEVIALRNEVKEKALSVASQNYFKMLGLQMGADQAAIRKAFFELAKKFHPDRCNNPALADLKELFEYIFTNISEAHSTLSNPDAYEEYSQRITHQGLSQEDEEALVKKLLSAEGAFQKALILFKKHDYRPAKRNIEEAVKLNPENGDYIALKVWIGAMERGAKAEVGDLVQDMEKALLLSPRSDMANFFMGLLLKRANRLADAVDYFEKTIEINPHHVDAQRELRLLAKQSETLKSSHHGFLRLFKGKPK